MSIRDVCEITFIYLSKVVNQRLMGARVGHKEPETTTHNDKDKGSSLRGR